MSKSFFAEYNKLFNVHPPSAWTHCHEDTKILVMLSLDKADVDTKSMHPLSTYVQKKSALLYPWHKQLIQCEDDIRTAGTRSNCFLIFANMYTITTYPLLSVKLK